MGVPEESIEGFITGLIRNGTIEDTGDTDQMNGSGEQPIYALIPLPPGPRHHPHKLPPERVVGYSEVLSPRGLPIRIRSERDMRRILSTSGARSKHVQREKRYQKMIEAQEKKLAAQARRLAEGKKATKTSKQKAADQAARQRSEKRKQKRANVEVW